MVKSVKAAMAVVLAGLLASTPGRADAWQGLSSAGAGIQRRQLIGYWASQSQLCSDGTGIRFGADGRYVSGEGSGRWTLRGNRLSLTNWGGGADAPVALRRNGLLVIRWDYGQEIFRRC